MNKKIAVILTGGTISMYKNKNDNLINIDEDQNEFITQIRDAFSGLEIEFNVYSLIPSPHMSLDKMFKLSKLIDSYVSDKTVSGVVVTHGTDTLEETAYMVDLYINSSKPVVFTGSMRNHSEASYDGFRNIIAAILVANSTDSFNQGTLVVLNDEINSAAEVTKSHTLSLDTFKSLDFGPLGIIDNEDVIFYRKRIKNTKHIKIDSITNCVEIVKISAGTSSLLLNLLIDSGIKGIVIETLGRGNITPDSLNGVKRAIDNNVPIVLTSRVPMGRVLGTYGYVGGGGYLKNLGVIFAPNLNAQKARIKLMMLLNSNIPKENYQNHFS